VRLPPTTRLKLVRMGADDANWAKNVRVTAAHKLRCNSAIATIGKTNIGTVTIP
jgi:hypothetical protein